MLAPAAAAAATGEDAALAAVADVKLVAAPETGPVGGLCAWCGCLGGEVEEVEEPSCWVVCVLGEVLVALSPLA